MQQQPVVAVHRSRYNHGVFKQKMRLVAAFLNLMAYGAVMLPKILKPLAPVTAGKLPLSCCT